MSSIYLHIGQMVEAELRRQERTVSWLARQLCCDRRNVYDIFSRPSIDTTLLLRISSALRHDFFADISRLFASSSASTAASSQSDTGK